MPTRRYNLRGQLYHKEWSNSKLRGFPNSFLLSLNRQQAARSAETHVRCSLTSKRLEQYSPASQNRGLTARLQHAGPTCILRAISGTFSRDQHKRERQRLLKPKFRQLHLTTNFCIISCLILLSYYKDWILKEIFSRRHYQVFSMRNLGKFKLGVGHGCFHSSGESNTSNSFQDSLSRYVLPCSHLTSRTKVEAWSSSTTHLTRNAQVSTTAWSS